MHKTLLAVAAAVATLVPTLAVAPAAQAAPAATTSQTARVVRWVDGDTVVTTKGEVRLIGVDTPERGDAGTPLRPGTPGVSRQRGPSSGSATQRV